MKRNLKGKTSPNGVLYTFNDTTIYLCIKSSESDVPSLSATGMTSQGCQTTLQSVSKFCLKCATHMDIFHFMYH